ncbi:Electron transfer flavoprotein-ubiquinone oxidoreductase [Pseudomonas fluorescens]|uniref:Electron transfer flavoprotein-ubiquinone oxidoreductase n=1 Tax=Pseudomonas fluorescens TaxID=294 RepID=A0A5E7UW33_PSEFL|nr:Electron transfer flavoprotein-ubiquinone oxidoreductase [Pseudomonas fluorescens]
MLKGYVDGFRASWLYEELQRSRNFGPALHKFGSLFGGGLNWLNQNIFGGKIPFTLHDTKPDHACLKPAVQARKIEYPKPDGKLSFDKLSSVFLSNTNHEEVPPCHLKLRDPTIPLSRNLPLYDEPAQRYCPTGYTRSSLRKTARSTFRSTRRTACTAKPVTSKTRPRTLIGWLRKVLAAPITPICECFLVEGGCRNRCFVQPNL